MQPREELLLGLGGLNDFELLSNVILENGYFDHVHGIPEPLNRQDYFEPYKTWECALDDTKRDLIQARLEKFYGTKLVQQGLWTRFEKEPNKPIILSANYDLFPESLPLYWIGSGVADECLDNGEDIPLPITFLRAFNGWIYCKTTTNLVFRFRRYARNPHLIFGDQLDEIKMEHISENLLVLYIKRMAGLDLREWLADMAVYWSLK